MDIEIAFNDKDKEIIGRYGFIRPKDLLEKDNEYLNPYYESVKEKRNEFSNEIAALKRTKTKDVSDEIKEKEDVKASLNKYLSAISDAIIALKKYLPKTGKGASRYKQPKRNAYKLQDNQYGGLMIAVPELMNRMKLNAYRGGKLVYEADADRSVIDLLTKRFNPKTKYSMNAVKIFNDLNMLSNMPPHKSSGKSRMVGSSVVFYQDPEQLVDRMKILIGSMAAGNNSPVLKNDLSQTNDELLKIGAIDRVIHEKFHNKYLK